MLEPERRSALDRELIEQRLGEAGVVVAGHERHLDLAQRFPELLEERAAALQRRPERQVAQLDHVAEEDEAVGAGYLLEEHAADIAVAQHVLVAGDAEVEVGDDRRPHPTLLHEPVWLSSQSG
jgi:hypothetical protein